MSPARATSQAVLRGDRRFAFRRAEQIVQNLRTALSNCILKPFVLGMVDPVKMRLTKNAS